MNRKFTWLVTPLLLGCLHLAEAQHPAKIFRIGYLDPSSEATTARLLEVFRQEMTKLGWVEGRTLQLNIDLPS